MTISAFFEVELGGYHNSEVINGSRKDDAWSTHPLLCDTPSPLQGAGSVTMGSYLAKLVKIEAKGLGLGWGEERGHQPPHG
jgi:hypothetical protein